MNILIRITIILKDQELTKSKVTLIKLKILNIINNLNVIIPLWEGWVMCVCRYLRPVGVAHPQYIEK